MADKIYCGSAKARQTQYGEQLTVSVDVSSLLENFIEYGFTSEKTGKKYITLKIGKRKDVGKYGDTHSVEIDTFKPESSAKKQDHPASPAPSFSSDIPF